MYIGYVKSANEIKKFSSKRAKITKNDKKLHNLREIYSKF